MRIIGYKAIRDEEIQNDHTNCFPGGASIVNRKLFDRLGGYDEKLKYSQDYDLFLRFAAKYRCANLPDYLINFRWDPDFEKQKEQHKIALQIRWKAIRKYGYSPIETLKLIPAVIKYMIPVKIKKFYWNMRLDDEN